METLEGQPGLVWRFPDLTVLAADIQAATMRRATAGFTTPPSCSSSHRLRERPPPYLTSAPLAPIRRWQGTTTLIGFEPLACPTARIALGASSFKASAP